MSSQIPNELPNLNDFESQLGNLIRSAATARPDQPLFKFAALWSRNHERELASNISSPERDEENNEHSRHVEAPECRSLVSTSQTAMRRESITIFIDYSNITAGLEIPGGAHPINPHGLAEFLENGRFCTEKQIAGSFPHAGHDIWKVWNQLNYRTRIASSGKEMFVDDSLHAQIFRVILQKNSAANNTIVLVTGDGNSNNNYSSFVEVCVFFFSFPNSHSIINIKFQCVLRAIEHNHRVEICSWKQRLNKVYLELASKNAHLITIRYLDEAKHKILAWV